jgi:hypothetical protein
MQCVTREREIEFKVIETGQSKKENERIKRSI